MDEDGSQELAHRQLHKYREQACGLIQPVADNIGRMLRIPPSPTHGLLVPTGRGSESIVLTCFEVLPYFSPLNVLPLLCGLEALIIISGFRENRLRWCAQILVQKCCLEPLGSSVHA